MKSLFLGLLVSFSVNAFAIQAGTYISHFSGENPAILNLVIEEEELGYTLSVHQISPPLKQFVLPYEMIVKGRHHNSKVFEFGELELDVSTHSLGNSFPIGVLKKFDFIVSMLPKLIITNEDGERFEFILEK